MSVEAPDRRALRREATRREILTAAWELASEHGVGALTMRDLGARVGMRAQSLYVYFDSKNALLDAMFADGYGELLRRLQELPGDRDPVRHLRRHVRCFADFACEDLARYQLLFLRVVPGFEPSAAAYEQSVRSFAVSRAALSACGVTRGRDADLFTAVFAGLIAQQNANEPGGVRWTRLADEALDMYLTHVLGDANGHQPSS